MPGVVALHLPQSHSWDQAEEPTQFQIQTESCQAKHAVSVSRERNTEK